MRAQLTFYISLLLVCFHLICAAQPIQKALQDYVTNKDSAYSWKINNAITTEEGIFYDVSLTSQSWQGMNWTHRLMMYFPKNGKHSNTLLLVLRHLYDRNAGLANLKYISDSTGIASAFLYDIPNQPLFGGKQEDDLQAYTFSQYLKTGDSSWPLLFPMVKSVIRAIDVIQDLALKEKQAPVNKFVVAGHSKRGHTSWLAAAVDKRIKGIIPMAIDVLNSKAQMPHHLKMFGAYTTPSDEATKFLSELSKPLGKSLIELIDPYYYKDQLALPKLIVSATNDEYFPTDALNLYWKGLKGSKSILYLSNAGHVGADSDPRINPTAFAFVRAVASEKTLPSLNWHFREGKDSLELIVTTNTLALSAVLWQATAKGTDFRGSQWYSIPMKSIDQGTTKRYVLSIRTSSSANGLVYGEIQFEQDGHKFLLSTQTYRYSNK